MPDSNSILNELEQLRAVRTDPPYNKPIGVTDDVKLFRVAAWGTSGHVAADLLWGETTGVETKPTSVYLIMLLYIPTIVQQ